MSDHTPDLSPDSLAIHADRHLNETSSVAPPIYQTSTFRAESAEEFLTMSTEARHDRFYTRYGNPTHAQAAAVLAALERAEAAMLFASGMGAISSAVLAHVGAGDHVVGQRNHYAGTVSLLRDMLPRFGVEVTIVDQTDTAAFGEALRPNTRMIVAETPTNPLLQVTDLRALAALARERNIVTLVDNTFATPFNQRPLELGIDLIAHSATKYLGGHADLIAGAVAGSAEALDRIWHTSIVLGATLNAFDSWLLLRGLRTLSLRVRRHNETALSIARFLEGHTTVERVHYPGLESHPQHGLARGQMSGFGGLLSFELKGGLAAAEQVISGVRLPARAASLGGVESLIAHPAAMWAGHYTEEQLDQAGIRPGLVRLATGLEDAGDLIADLEQALAAVEALRLTGSPAASAR